MDQQATAARVAFKFAFFTLHFLKSTFYHALTVLPALTSPYAQWRVQSGAVPILHEDAESPPERLLQAVWQHQRLRRDTLLTLDGQPVRILHPGFLSVEGGPDFRGALVQLGNGPARAAPWSCCCAASRMRPWAN